jgi:hypothetical protein
MRYIIESIVLIALIAFAVGFTPPQVSFAGFGPVPNIMFAAFTDGASAPDAEPQNIQGEQAAEENKNFPIHGGEAIDGNEDIQAIAARNAEAAQAIVDAGGSAPNLPATAANLASFQQREVLPEQQRKGLEPTMPKEEEPQQAPPEEQKAAEPQYS